MVATVPPSTDQWAPVTSAARSEQRKTTTLAISSAVPKRPSVVFALLDLDRLLAREAARVGGLVGEPASSIHSEEGDRAGRDGVDEHALGPVGVGEHARERGLRGLGHRVGGVGERGALAGRRGHVDDPAPAVLGHPGANARMSRIEAITCSSHWRLPVLLGQLVERPAKLVPALLTRMSGAPPSRSAICRRRRARSRRSLRARDHQHARALLLEQADGRRADAAARAGHDRRAAGQSQVHPCMMPG